MVPSLAPVWQKQTIWKTYITLWIQASGDVHFHPMTYRENYTWLCIFQWETLFPRPQSHRQTLRRWPGRDRECFHPSALHQGCRHKQKLCFLRRANINRLLWADLRATCECHVPRYYWMCEFCSVASPHVRLPQPARPAAAEKDITMHSRLICPIYRFTLEQVASRVGVIIFEYKWKVKCRLPHTCWALLEAFLCFVTSGWFAMPE